MKRQQPSSSSSSSSDDGGRQRKVREKRRKESGRVHTDRRHDGSPEKQGGGCGGRGGGSNRGGRGVSSGGRGGGDGVQAANGAGWRDSKENAGSGVKTEAAESLEDYKKRKIKHVESLGRSGGVYIPPYKVARLQQDIEDKTSPEFQRQAWEALRKSINGLVNKVNVSNIKNLVEELFQENLVRGRGLFVRAIIRAQMASPGFTHVFAALVAVLNSKLPELGDLLIRRVILQFRRAYKRHDKIVTTAVIKFMAHLVNQKVVSDLLCLHVATLLLERVTEDSIEVCASFMQEVGMAMKELSPSGTLAIFERFRNILHEGQINRRVQYVIESLFDVRRRGYQDFPAVLPELELVEEDDQFTHEVDLLDENIKGEEALNIFKAQPPEQYVADEAKWKQISSEILGLEDEDGDESNSSDDSEEEKEAQEADQRTAEKIVDFTDQDLVNLRRQIYLVIMSSLQFEECVHKILKLNIAPGQEKEVCTMLIDCCAMDRVYSRFFAFQGERLCRLKPEYQEQFQDAFSLQFGTVHRLETNKLRNIGKLFAHLLFTDAISWSILSIVRMTEETTTSSSRIFIKNIFQELSEQWGVQKLSERFAEPELQQFFGGLFPKDHPKNMRFAINYYTAIGLGVLTEGLREYLNSAGPDLDRQKGPVAAQEESSSSDSDSESDSSDSSDSSGSSDTSSS
eukprot:TRINITY_DN61435_c0_g1_i1.p1 TRINITY_DN61435_c0_g1~~TRINITY_DN61435_c0_g1_i1.p1  ORF type:complete len:683 (-),score=127.17 TRINITY_DN61435_c0_g1_i1:164-2212(-)